MRIEVIEPERVLTFRFEDGHWVWIFALFPEEGATRLVSRNRIATPGASRLTRLFNLLFMEPGSLVMERTMLLGIKARAERLARSDDCGSGSGGRRSNLHSRLQRPVSCR